MKKITAIILTVVLTAMGAMMIFAQDSTNTDGKKEFGRKGHHGKRGGKRGHRGGKGMMFRGLDLTDAQKAQVKQITQTSRENSKSVHEQMKANRQQLEAISQNGNFDAAQVQALAAQQGNLHAQMIVEQQRVKSQIYQILTPEQKAKAAEMKANFKQKMQERQQKRAERKAQKEAADNQ